MTPDKGLVLFLLIDFIQDVFGDKHSLLYLYTIQAKTSNIYHFTAVTLLNDTQIDFYSSVDQSRTPEIPESAWKTRTEKEQFDKDLLNKLLYMQISDSGDSESDGHVLQWRHGCEGSNGFVTALKSISEFGYDGEDLIQFNCNTRTWLTPETKKNRTREEQWSERYLYKALGKCEQCEEVLKMYLQYSTTDITRSHSPPAVHVFAKKSVRDSSKLTLTCLATGFYPKHVEMSLWNITTENPEHLVTSSEIRPNDDGTYQLRKSVEIPENDKAQYCCYLTHSSLREPVIKDWVKRRTVRPTNTSRVLMIVGGVSGLLITLYPLIVGDLNRRIMDLLLGGRRIQLGLMVAMIVTELSFVIPCVLMIINHGSTNCSGNISQGFMIGAVTSGVVMFLCPAIQHVPIIKTIKFLLGGRRIQLGLMVARIVTDLSFLIVCVLVIMKHGRCTNCSGNISQGLMIGWMTSAVVMFLCNAIQHVPIIKTINFLLGGRRIQLGLVARIVADLSFLIVSVLMIHYGICPDCPGTIYLYVIIGALVSGYVLVVLCVVFLQEKRRRMKEEEIHKETFGSKEVM